MFDALKLATSLGCGPLTDAIRQLATFAGVELDKLPDAIPEKTAAADAPGMSHRSLTASAKC